MPGRRADCRGPVAAAQHVRQCVARGHVTNLNLTREFDSITNTMIIYYPRVTHRVTSLQRRRTGAGRSSVALDSKLPVTVVQVITNIVTAAATTPRLNHDPAISYLDRAGPPVEIIIVYRHGLGPPPGTVFKFKLDPGRRAVTKKHPTRWPGCQGHWCQSRLARTAGARWPGPSESESTLAAPPRPPLRRVSGPRPTVSSADGLPRPPSLT